MRSRSSCRAKADVRSFGYCFERKEWPAASAARVAKPQRRRSPHGGASAYADVGHRRRARARLRFVPSESVDLHDRIPRGTRQRRRDPARPLTTAARTSRAASPCDLAPPSALEIVLRAMRCIRGPVPRDGHLGRVQRSESAPFRQHEASGNRSTEQLAPQLSERPSEARPPLGVYPTRVLSGRARCR